MTFTHFDQSTWMAYRGQAAQEMGDPPIPKMVALPGAKAAISHDHLLAHQEAGRGEHEIRERVNAKWAEANREQTERHARWVSGPYSQAIEEMRRRAAEKAAEEMRAQAIFQDMIRERENRARDPEASR